MLITWKCKKVQLMLLVCRISNWLISKAVSWNFFVEVNIQMFLVTFGLFVKMICLLDQFFIRHIDGKYGKATAPLVENFKSIFLTLGRKLHHFHFYLQKSTVPWKFKTANAVTQVVDRIKCTISFAKSVTSGRKFV